MRTTINRTAAILIGAVLLFAAAACGSDTSASDTSGDTSTSAEAPSTEIESEEVEGALVDSFPDDIPLYDGTIIESKAGMSEVSGDPEWNVHMDTDDPVETVNESLRADYSSNGWEISSEMTSGSSHLFTASNSDYIVSVTYNDMFGTINYGVSAK